MTSQVSSQPSHETAYDDDVMREAMQVERIWAATEKSILPSPIPTSKVASGSLETKSTCTESISTDSSGRQKPIMGNGTAYSKRDLSPIFSRSFESDEYTTNTFEGVFPQMFGCTSKEEYNCTSPIFFRKKYFSSLKEQSKKFPSWAKLSRSSTCSIESRNYSQWASHYPSFASTLEPGTDDDSSFLTDHDEQSTLAGMGLSSWSTKSEMTKPDARVMRYKNESLYSSSDRADDKSSCSEDWSITENDESENSSHDLLVSSDSSSVLPDLSNKFVIGIHPTTENSFISTFDDASDGNPIFSEGSAQICIEENAIQPTYSENSSIFEDMSKVDDFEIYKQVYTLLSEKDGYTKEFLDEEFLALDETFPLASLASRSHQTFSTEYSASISARFDVKSDGPYRSATTLRRGKYSALICGTALFAFDDFLHGEDDFTQGDFDDNSILLDYSVQSSSMAPRRQPVPILNLHQERWFLACDKSEKPLDFADSGAKRVSLSKVRLAKERSLICGSILCATRDMLIPPVEASYTVTEKVEGHHRLAKESSKMKELLSISMSNDKAECAHAPQEPNVSTLPQEAKLQPFYARDKSLSFLDARAKHVPYCDVHQDKEKTGLCDSMLYAARENLHQGAETNNIMSDSCPKGNTCGSQEHHKGNALSSINMSGDHSERTLDPRQSNALILREETRLLPLDVIDARAKSVSYCNVRHAKDSALICGSMYFAVNDMLDPCPEKRKSASKECPRSNECGPKENVDIMSPKQPTTLKQKGALFQQCDPYGRPLSLLDTPSQSVSYCKVRQAKESAIICGSTFFAANDMLYQRMEKCDPMLDTCSILNTYGPMGISTESNGSNINMSNGKRVVTAPTISQESLKEKRHKNVLDQHIEVGGIPYVVSTTDEYVEVHLDPEAQTMHPNTVLCSEHCGVEESTLENDMFSAQESSDMTNVVDIKVGHEDIELFLSFESTVPENVDERWNPTLPLHLDEGRESTQISPANASPPHERCWRDIDKIIQVANTERILHIVDVDELNPTECGAPIQPTLVSPTQSTGLSRLHFDIHAEDELAFEVTYEDSLAELSPKSEQFGMSSSNLVLFSEIHEMESTATKVQSINEHLLSTDANLASRDFHPDEELASDVASDDGVEFHIPSPHEPYDSVLHEEAVQCFPSFTEMTDNELNVDCSARRSPTTLLNDHDDQINATKYKKIKIISINQSISSSELSFPSVDVRADGEWAAELISYASAIELSPSRDEQRLYEVPVIQDLDLYVVNNIPFVEEVQYMDDNVDCIDLTLSDTVLSASVEPYNEVAYEEIGTEPIINQQLISLNLSFPSFDFDADTELPVGESSTEAETITLPPSPKQQGMDELSLDSHMADKVENTMPFLGKVNTMDEMEIKVDCSEEIFLEMEFNDPVQLNETKDKPCSSTSINEQPVMKHVLPQDLYIHDADSADQVISGDSDVGLGPLSERHIVDDLPIKQRQIVGYHVVEGAEDIVAADCTEQLFPDPNDADQPGNVMTCKVIKIESIDQTINDFCLPSADVGDHEGSAAELTSENKAEIGIPPNHKPPRVDQLVKGLDVTDDDANQLYSLVEVKGMDSMKINADSIEHVVPNILLNDLSQLIRVAKVELLMIEGLMTFAINPVVARLQESVQIKVYPQFQPSWLAPIDAGRALMNALHLLPHDMYTPFQLVKKEELIQLFQGRFDAYPNRCSLTV